MSVGRGGKGEYTKCADEARGSFVRSVIILAEGFVAYRRYPPRSYCWDLLFRKLLYGLWQRE
jgi:hypothetical protein